MAAKKQVEIFTDGRLLGNPGPGGYGVILRYKGVSKELSGGEERTTNNRMELTARHHPAFPPSRSRAR